jgi:hypothetical protein
LGLKALRTLGKSQRDAIRLLELEIAQSKSGSESASAALQSLADAKKNEILYKEQIRWHERMRKRRYLKWTAQPPIQKARRWIKANLGSILSETHKRLWNDGLRMYADVSGAANSARFSQ